MDFSIYGATYNKEQQKRRQLAKQKLEEAKKVEIERRKLDREIQEKQLKVLQAQEEAREEKERILSSSGLFLEVKLTPVDLYDGEGDKIVLPPSVLEQFTNSLTVDGTSVFDQGAILFQVHCQETNKSTHVGMREFNGEEGQVALPSKVQASLGLDLTRSKAAPILLRYIQLPKAHKVTFQPLEVGFSQLTIDVQQLLEDQLRLHATLTVGDILTVYYGNQPHTLKVVDLQPEDCVCILNTNVEVEIDLPESIKRKQQEADRIRKEEYQRQIEIEKKQQLVTSHILTLLQEVPQEPEDSAEYTVLCVVNMPNGHKLQRRFSLHHPLKGLFNLVEAKVLETGDRETGDVTAVSFKIVTRFPRKEYCKEDESKTFLDLGIAQREQFFVEIIG
eukprot:Platyproteum_vivax@DN10607_c0_g1_i1.p1